MKRASGILLPISSLPSAYGIGCFSKEAYAFVDRLKEAGQRYWQILPLGPTGYGDSPYQSFSTFAGNPYFIDLEALIRKGWLTKAECDKAKLVSHPNYVEYEWQYLRRLPLLKKAYAASEIKKVPDFLEFCEENAFWLPEYALFMALKEHFNGVAWTEWNADIRLREPEALIAYRLLLDEEITYHCFVQYLFIRQWEELKAYANDAGVQIIGDLPIYVAFDSADCWAAPELFQFDEAGEALGIAGCPPDAYAATGQLWGNPLYDWEYHKKTNFEWWMKRLAYSFYLYDVVRVDHFRGFEAYYAIPYGAKDAVIGEWKQGPGYALFARLRECFGELPVIAENLGFLTAGVYALLEQTGYPGMKVLHFAFDEQEHDSEYLPHHYPTNCIAYTGTHDNDTSLGWYLNLTKPEKRFVDDYLDLTVERATEIGWVLARAVMRSAAETVIIPMQDYLGLGSEARMNIPSTVGTNWKWRMSKDAFTPMLAQRIRRLTKLYGRMAE